MLIEKSGVKQSRIDFEIQIAVVVEDEQPEDWT